MISRAERQETTRRALIAFLCLCLAPSVFAKLSESVPASSTPRPSAPTAETESSASAISECKTGVGYYDEKNYREAVKWFRKAAEQNYAPAECALAFAYFFGQGVEKNKLEAVRWFRKAAEQNNVDAQFMLGAAHHNGEGVARNKVEA